MVFNSGILVSVANVSADVWQYIACLPERISSQQLLDLICCFPLQQLGRFALCFWTFFCFSPPDSYVSYYYHDSDSSSTTDYDNDGPNYYSDSHSD